MQTDVKLNNLCINPHPATQKTYRMNLKPAILAEFLFFGKYSLSMLKRSVMCRSLMAYLLRIGQ